MNYENTIRIKPGFKTGRYACYSDCEEVELVQPTHPDCVAIANCKECGQVVDYIRVTPGPRIKIVNAASGTVTVSVEQENYDES